MPNATNKEFTSEISKKLGHYVYRLIDPRNGETFYVGKGKENRVFQHIKFARNVEFIDELDYKLQTIKEINNAGLDVIHVIHRHGLDEDTALEDRFSLKPMEIEVGEIVTIATDTQQKLELVKNYNEVKSTSKILSSLREKYNLIVDNISNILKKIVRVDEATKNFNEHLKPFNKKTSITKNCTLPKTKETNHVLSRIEELREQMN